MSDDGRAFDDRHVSYREFAGAVLRSSEEMARLRERQATTEATLLHEVAAVRSDVSEMKQMMLRQPEQVNHGALAAQRAMDMMEASRRPGGSPFLVIFSVLGALALGFMGARFLLGG